MWTTSIKSIVNLSFIISTFDQQSFSNFMFFHFYLDSLSVLHPYYLEKSNPAIPLGVDSTNRRKWMWDNFIRWRSIGLFWKKRRNQKLQDFPCIYIRIQSRQYAISSFVNCQIFVSPHILPTPLPRTWR